MAVIKFLRNRFWENQFFLDVGKLLGGAAFAQILLILAAPLLAQLYNPADFGQLGLYISALGLSSSVAMMRYEAAIPGCPDDYQASRVFFLSVLVAAVFSFATAIVISTPWARMIFRRLGFTFQLWIIPLGIVLSSLYSASALWAVRKSDFNGLAKTKGTQGFSMVTTQILSGVIGWRPEGLLVGHMLGQSGGIVYLIKRMLKREQQLFRNLKMNEIIQVLIIYKKFPRYSVPAVLIESFAGNIPLVVLAFQFGPVIAGWVTLIHRSFLMPMALLANNIAQVNFAEFARLKQASVKDLLPYFNKRLRELWIFGFLISICTGVIGHWGINRFFGPEWRSAIWCLWLFLPMSCLSFIATSFSCLTEIFGRQELHLVREIVRGGLMGLSLALLLLFNFDWKTALSCISVAGILGSFVYLWTCKIVIRRFLYEETIRKSM